ncbi:hypothetical protein NDI39_12855 [Microcoleus sp. ZQ-A2]|nr:hypothetical protein [Microcoleus sp. FACHB-1]
MYRLPYNFNLEKLMERLHEPKEMIAQRYRIVERLGLGKNGTSYYVEDL